MDKNGLVGSVIIAGAFILASMAPSKMVSAKEYTSDWRVCHDEQDGEVYKFHGRYNKTSNGNRDTINWVEFKYRRVAEWERLYDRKNYKHSIAVRTPETLHRSYHNTEKIGETRMSIGATRKRPFNITMTHTMKYDATKRPLSQFDLPVLGTITVECDIVFGTGGL